MPRKKDDKTYYERLRQRLYDNRYVAWTVLIAGAVLAALKFYNELTGAVHQAWKETGTVRFSTQHVPLIERGKVEVRRNSHAVNVVGFNAPVTMELGSYHAAAHIDSRVLLQQPFMVQPAENEVVFDARFAVKGIVVNGQGRPLANVVVTINDRRAKTKNDGLFVLDNLPMQRIYDIVAYPDSGGAFSSQHPWTGTVYNGNWDITVTQNIALVRSP